MSVCNLSADSTIASIVEAMLPRGGSRPMGLDVPWMRGPEGWEAGVSPTKALYIAVKVGLSHYTDEGDEDHERATIHLIFCRPTNYTKVFSCVNDSWSIPKADDFTMRSDHDSCWRSDGMRDISATYLKCLHNIRERIGRDAQQPSEFNTIHSIQWVNITWKDDPEDQHRYRKILTAIWKTP